MDVESQLKLNELAKDLVKKGLAPSSDDALKMAQTIMQKEAPKENKSSVEQANLHEKYEILLERYNRKIAAELTSLKEQVKVLSTQLSFITDDINKIKRSNIETGPAQNMETKSQEKAQNKKEASNDSFTKDDVAVDKIFYFGKK